MSIEPLLICDGIRTDTPNKITNYAQPLPQEYGIHCSLLCFIQTYNKSTQEARTQTGILYKYRAFKKKYSLKWSYRYFHSTPFLFGIYV